MASFRGYHKRVRRLERISSPRSPIEVAYESLESFMTETQAEIDAGRLDRIDGPIILNCIRRWHNDRLWLA